MVIPPATEPPVDANIKLPVCRGRCHSGWRTHLTAGWGGRKLVAPRRVRSPGTEMDCDRNYLRVTGCVSWSLAQAPLDPPPLPSADGRWRWAMGDGRRSPGMDRRRCSVSAFPSLSVRPLRIPRREDCPRGTALPPSARAASLGGRRAWHDAVMCQLPYRPSCAAGRFVAKLSRLTATPASGPRPPRPAGRPVNFQDSGGRLIAPG